MPSIRKRRRTTRCSGACSPPSRSGDLNWDSPQIKHLDHMYANLDRADGLYWAYEASGFVERVVTAEQVNHFIVNPPADTRAWTRAMLLRWAGEKSVANVNWDRMEFDLEGEGDDQRRQILSLPNPLGATRALAEPYFRDAVTLAELLASLGAREGKVRAENTQALDRYGAQYNDRYNTSWPLNTFEKQLLARALWNWRPSR